MRTSNFEAKKSDDRNPATVQMATLKGVENGIFSRDLMTGLMGMVPTLGGANVTVGFAGENAFCDSTLSYVNIPALPPADIIPLQIAREIRGFAAHEAAHIAFTDPEIFPSRIVNDKGEFDKLLKEVWNCVEDFMIEKHWLALYPGAKKNFAATEVRCCRGYMDLHQKDPDCAKDLRRVGPVALTWMRSLYFCLGVSASRECLSTLPVNLRQRVMGWFRDIEDVETTEDCLEAARIIHADILKDPFDPQDPPKKTASPKNQQGQQDRSRQGQSNGQSAQQQGQGQGQANQSGQKGKGNQPGQGSQGDKSRQKAHPDGTEQGKQGQDPSGQGANGQKGSGPLGGAEGAPDPFPGNAGPDPISTSTDIEKVLKDAGKTAQNPNWISAEVLSTASSGPAAGILSGAEGRQIAQAAEKEIQGAVAATSNQLRRALKAVAKDRWKGGRFDGKIDHHHLARIASGNMDVYKRKVKGEKIDTAVSILVDVSQSMKGSRLDICQQLALILEKALANTPIKHEIVGFTTANLKDADPTFKTMVKAHEKRGDNLAPRAIGLYEFRNFDQGHFSALQTIGNMTRVPVGMTPTSDAILLTHDRLARRPERRHVMFVLTDGKPDDRASCKEAVEAVEACGVTVVGIGIGTNAVNGLFSNAVVLGNAGDLPALMMSHLSRMLLGDKNKAALKGHAALKARGK